MKMISVDQLVRRYGDFTAVDGISLSVDEGEIFGFLGPNGAGKTTTINMLCTLLKPTSGSASIAGYDVVREHTSVREQIGIIFQDPSLDDKLTARENLDFHARIFGIRASDRPRRIAEVLEMVELADKSTQIVKTFSGGMKRRLEIARGLIHSPRVLFLDEPTLGLDPQTRVHIWDYLLRLRDERQVTIFLTTHYMEEAENCGRIAIIDHGKIKALDTPEGLKQMVGGDVIRLTTTEPEALSAEVERLYGLKNLVDAEAETVSFEVPQADAFLPGLLRDVGSDITAVEMRRPTLEDVFIKLTGRAMRDAEVGGVDAMRLHARAWRSRRGA